MLDSVFTHARVSVELDSLKLGAIPGFRCTDPRSPKRRVSISSPMVSTPDSDTQNSSPGSSPQTHLSAPDNYCKSPTLPYTTRPKKYNALKAFTCHLALTPYPPPHPPIHRSIAPRQHIKDLIGRHSIFLDPKPKRQDHGARIRELQHTNRAHQARHTRKTGDSSARPRLLHRHKYCTHHSAFPFARVSGGAFSNCRKTSTQATLTPM